MQPKHAVFKKSTTLHSYILGLHTHFVLTTPRATSGPVNSIHVRALYMCIIVCLLNCVFMYIVLSCIHTTALQLLRAFSAVAAVQVHVGPRCVVGCTIKV